MFSKVSEGLSSGSFVLSRLGLHATHGLYWKKRDRRPGHGLERTSMAKEAWAGGSHQYLQLRGRFVVNQGGKESVPEDALGRLCALSHRTL